MFKILNSNLQQQNCFTHNVTRLKAGKKKKLRLIKKKEIRFQRFKKSVFKAEKRVFIISRCKRYTVAAKHCDYVWCNPYIFIGAKEFEVTHFDLSLFFTIDVNRDLHKYSYRYKLHWRLLTIFGTLCIYLGSLNSMDWRKFWNICAVFAFIRLLIQEEF